MRTQLLCLGLLVVACASGCQKPVAENQNRPPAFDPISPVTLEGGQTVNVDVSAKDPDGDALTLALGRDAPGFVSLLGTTLTISPGQVDTGAYAVVLTATDPAGASATATLSITVKQRHNTAPTLVPPLDVTMVEGDTQTVTLIATDPESDPVTFSLQGAPTWITVSGAKATLSPPLAKLQADGGTPPPSAVGTQAFAVVASDGALSDTKVWKVVVTEKPVVLVSAIQLDDAGMALSAGAQLVTPPALRASIDEPHGSPVRLEVEVQPLGTAFTNAPTSTSPTASGAVLGDGGIGLVTTTIALTSLRPADYHWQARAVTDQSKATAWQPFASGATAFTIMPQAVTLGDGGILLAGGAQYVSNPNAVPLFIDAVASQGATLSTMQVTGDITVQDSSPVTYNQIRSLNLTSGDGTKTVTVVVKDSFGNTGTFTESIILDATPPSIPANPKGTGLRRTAAFSWSASTDATSGLAGYEVAEMTSSTASLVFQPLQTALSFTDATLQNAPDPLPAGTVSQARYFFVRARDNAGNVSPVTQPVTILPRFAFTYRFRPAVVDITSVARRGNNGVAVGIAGLVLSTQDGFSTFQRNDPQTDEHLYGVALVDATTFVAVGDHGTALLSTDIGATWKPIATSLATALRGLALSKGPTVVGNDTTTEFIAVGDGGKILKLSVVMHVDPSTSAKSYSATASAIAQSAATSNLLSVTACPTTFACAGTLMAGGASGTIISSTDYGATWGLEPAGATGDVVALAHDAAPATSFLAGTNTAKLYKRTGTTWAAYSPTGMSRTLATTSYISMTAGTTANTVFVTSAGFSGTGSGACGFYNNSICTYTYLDRINTSAGTASTVITEREDPESVRVVSFDGTSGVALGGYGSVYTSTNSGTSFAMTPAALVTHNNHFTSVAPSTTPGKTTWLAGAGSTYFTSATFQQQSYDLTQHLLTNSTGSVGGLPPVVFASPLGGSQYGIQAMAARSETDLVAVARYGETYNYIVPTPAPVTAPTWTAVNPIFGCENFFDAECIPNGKCIAVGGNWMIETFTPGSGWSHSGGTCAPGTTTGNGFYYNLGVTYYTDSTGVRRGVIVGTALTPFFATAHYFTGYNDVWDWLNPKVLPGGPLNDVAGRPEGTVIAVGVTGRIFRSTDHGTSWSPITSGTAAQLNKVAYAGGSTNTWYIVGNGGTLLKSTDDGLTWRSMVTNSTQQFVAVAAEGDNLWVVPFGPAVLFSYTGGE